MSLCRLHDWEDVDDGDEGLRQSPPAKRRRCSCRHDDKQMELLEEMRSLLQGQNEMRSLLQGQNEKIESIYRENKDLREKVLLITADISRHGGYLQQSRAPNLSADTMRMLSDQNCSIPLRLQFVNSCSKDMYSTHKIEADDKKPLKVAIYDHNKKIITCEPFSSMRVHIVAVHGDFDDDHKGHWTEEHFRSKIVIGRRRPRKEHLLSGDRYFRLQDGVGYINNAKFQDNSSFVPSKRFKLGVMTADEKISERIQEGLTESFAVKDIRGFSTKKRDNPSPHDAVYKLSRIALHSNRHKLLEQNGIKTVGDLLCFYRKSPEDLRKIMGKISDQDWDAVINHAHKCNPGPGVYSSCIQDWNVSNEHEPFSRSNGSCYIKASSSMQPSSTIEKLDVQVAHQQTSSTYNGLSFDASLENVPSMSKFQPNTSNQNIMHHGELEVIPVVDQRVSSVGNEVILSMDNNSSQQQHSLEHNITPESDGNGLSHVNPFVDDTGINEVRLVEKYLMSDDVFLMSDDVRVPWVNVRAGIENFTEQNGYPASEEDSINFRGISPSHVSEEGGRDYKIDLNKKDPSRPEPGSVRPKIIGLNTFFGLAWARIFGTK